ncbi:MAG: 5-bromo-4-chloroindolyl phosphate hydrolysis family protein [Ruthenibacterium sp.]
MKQNSHGAKVEKGACCPFTCRGRISTVRWRCPSTGCGRWRRGLIAAYGWGKAVPPRTVLVDAPAAIYATGEQAVDEMLREAQENVDAIARLNEAIEDAGLSAAMARMEQAGRAILAEVAKAPAKGKNIRKFTAYYLPTAVKVLTTYAKLDASGAQGQNAQALMAEVKKNANTIAAAFESQLDALFSGEVLDVSTDLKVLDGIARGDGLVDEGLKARLAGTAADLGAQNEDGPTLTL